MKSPKGKALKKKYDMDKGSLTWQEKMKANYKNKKLPLPAKLKK